VRNDDDESPRKTEQPKGGFVSGVSDSYVIGVTKGRDIEVCGYVVEIGWGRRISQWLSCSGVS
jgi:hypothetical protein